MTINMAAAATKAQQKIQAYGRQITFFTKAKVPVDADKPWLGFEDGEISESTYGVFLTPNQVRIFGLSALGEATKFEDMFHRSEQVLVSFIPTDVDVKQFNFVRDYDGTVWKIDALQEFKPKDVRILVYAGTSR